MSDDGDLFRLKEAPSEVRERFDRILKKHAPGYLEQDVRFILLWRAKAPVSKGCASLGKASLFKDRDRAMLGLVDEHQDYHFVIEISADTWEKLSEEQKDALLFHELCHCHYAGGKAKIRKHTVECFAAEVRKYGCWSSALKNLDQAVRQGDLFPDAESPSSAVAATEGDGTASQKVETEKPKRSKRNRR